MRSTDHHLVHYKYTVFTEHNLLLAFYTRLSCWRLGSKGYGPVVLLGHIITRECQEVSMFWKMASEGIFNIIGKTFPCFPAFLFLNDDSLFNLSGLGLETFLTGLMVVKKQLSVHWKNPRVLSQRHGNLSR